MSPDLDYVRRAKERYAEWERSSHINFIVCFSVALVAALLYPQKLLPAFSCLVSGVAIFIAWRAFISDRINLSLVFGIAGVILSFPPLIFGENLPLPIVLLQGIPLVTTSLFACILISRSRLLNHEQKDSSQK